MSLPGVSCGEDRRGAQQFFIQVSTGHRERRMLSKQHSPDGEQSLKYIMMQHVTQIGNIRRISTSVSTNTN